MTSWGPKFYLSCLPLSCCCRQCPCTNDITYLVILKEIYDLLQGQRGYSWAIAVNGRTYQKLCYSNKPEFLYHVIRTDWPSIKYEAPDWNGIKYWCLSSSVRCRADLQGNFFAISDRDICWRRAFSGLWIVATDNRDTVLQWFCVEI